MSQILDVIDVPAPMENENMKRLQKEMVAWARTLPTEYRLKAVTFAALIEPYVSDMEARGRIERRLKNQAYAYLYACNLMHQFDDWKATHPAERFDTELDVILTILKDE